MTNSKEPSSSKSTPPPDQSAQPKPKQPDPPLIKPEKAYTAEFAESET